MSGSPDLAPGLIERLADGATRLIGGRCRACDEPQFPLGRSCPMCGGDAIEQLLLADRGTLWGWTVVSSPPPGYLGPVPYGFGVVELPDGLRIVTRIAPADPAALAFGQPMRLEPCELPTDDGSTAVAWQFVPDDQP